MSNRNFNKQVTQSRKPLAVGGITKILKKLGKQIASGIGQAINKVKTKINKTKLDKANSTLGIAKQK